MLTIGIYLIATLLLAVVNGQVSTGTIGDSNVQGCPYKKADGSAALAKVGDSVANPDTCQTCKCTQYTDRNTGSTFYRFAECVATADCVKSGCPAECPAVDCASEGLEEIKDSCNCPKCVDRCANHQCTPVTCDPDTQVKYRPVGECCDRCKPKCDACPDVQVQCNAETEQLVKDACNCDKCVPKQDDCALVKCAEFVQCSDNEELVKVGCCSQCVPLDPCANIQCHECPFGSKRVDPPTDGTCCQCEKVEDPCTDFCTGKTAVTSCAEGEQLIRGQCPCQNQCISECTGIACEKTSTSDCPTGQTLVQDGCCFKCQEVDVCANVLCPSIQSCPFGQVLLKADGAKRCCDQCVCENADGFLGGAAVIGTTDPCLDAKCPAFEGQARCVYNRCEGRRFFVLADGTDVTEQCWNRDPTDTNQCTTADEVKDDGCNTYTCTDNAWVKEAKPCAAQAGSLTCHGGQTEGKDRCGCPVCGCFSSDGALRPPCMWDSCQDRVCPGVEGAKCQPNRCNCEPQFFDASGADVSGQCGGSTVDCSLVKCAQLVCPIGSTLLRKDGECCPGCQGATCENPAEPGALLANGQSVGMGPCATAVCRDGQIEYQKKECFYNCPMEQVEFADGACCGRCVNVFEVVDDSLARCPNAPEGTKLGELYSPNADACMKCSCHKGDDGKHHERCYSIEDRSISCPDNQLAVFEAGVCGGKCVDPSGTTCGDRPNGAVWRERCRTLKCDNGEVHAYPVVCPEIEKCPNDAQPVESADGCCKTCPPTTQCLEGATRRSADSQCDVHQCVDGNWVQLPIRCPAVLCADGQAPSLQNAGDCCETCPRPTETECTGKTEGFQFQRGPCVQCKCVSATFARDLSSFEAATNIDAQSTALQPVCSVQSCPDTSDCPNGVERVEGKCCPVCKKVDGCVAGDNAFDGQWKPADSPCTVCQCTSDGKKDCQHVACPRLLCENPVQRDGSCCPSCPTSSCTEKCASLDVVSYKVCGADGQTYESECLARCAGTQAVSRGECSTTVPIACPLNYLPVCAGNNRTYSNACFAKAAGWEAATLGPCGKEEAVAKCETPDNERVCPDGSKATFGPVTDRNTGDQTCQWSSCPTRTCDNVKCPDFSSTTGDKTTVIPLGGCCPRDVPKDKCYSFEAGAVLPEGCCADLTRPAGTAATDADALACTRECRMDKFKGPQWVVKECPNQGSDDRQLKLVVSTDGFTKEQLQALLAMLTKDLPSIEATCDEDQQTCELRQKEDSNDMLPKALEDVSAVIEQNAGLSIVEATLEAAGLTDNNGSSGASAFVLATSAFAVLVIAAIF